MLHSISGDAKTLVLQNNNRSVWTELCDFPLACTLLSVLSHTHMMDLKVIRAKFLKYTPLKEDKTCLEGRRNKMILNVQENYVSLWFWVQWVFVLYTFVQKCRIEFIFSDRLLPILCIYFWKYDTSALYGSNFVTFLKVNNRCSHLLGLFSSRQNVGFVFCICTCRLDCICPVSVVFVPPSEPLYLQNVGSGGRPTSWSRPGTPTSVHPSTSCTASTASASR